MTGLSRRETELTLSVSTTWHDRVATVSLGGELDLGSRDRLERAIGEAVSAEGTRSVLVDLANLEFIDSSGIGMLLKGRRQADAVGVGYQVSAATGIVQQVLSLTGVLEHLAGGSS
jgi:anti-anti-sigma factor